MNILYPDFLAHFIDGTVKLTGEGASKFKLALFKVDKSLEENELIGTTGNTYLNSDDGTITWGLGHFRQLQNLGYEVSEEGTGYQAGGLPLVFDGPHKDKGRDKLSKLYYDCDKVFKWGSETSPANFTTYNAGIYIDAQDGGEYDGLMVAWYDFAEPKTVTDGIFSLDFSKSHLISIKQDLYQTTEGTTIQTDDILDTESHNPISNKAVTNALLNLGTKLGLGIGDNEKDLEVLDIIEAEGTDSELDTVNALETQRILDLFNNITGDH